MKRSDVDPMSKPERRTPSSPRHARVLRCAKSGGDNPLFVRDFLANSRVLPSFLSPEMRKGVRSAHCQPSTENSDRRHFGEPVEILEFAPDAEEFPPLFQSRTPSVTDSDPFHCQVSTQTEPQNSSKGMQTLTRLRRPQELVTGEGGSLRPDADVLARCFKQDVLLRDVIEFGKEKGEHVKRELMRATRQALDLQESAWLPTQESQQKETQSTSVSRTKVLDMCKVRNRSNRPKDVQRIVQQTADQLQAEAWTLYRLSDDGDSLEVLVSEDTQKIPPLRQLPTPKFGPIKRGITLKALGLPEALVVCDARSEGMYSNKIDRQAQSSIDGETLGVLQMVKYRSAPFHESDTALVQNIATMVSFTLDSYFCRQRAKEAEFESFFLKTVTLEMSGHCSLNEVLDCAGRVLAECLNLPSAQHAAIWLEDAQTNDLWTQVIRSCLYCHMRQTPNGADVYRLPCAAGLAGECFISKETIQIEQCASDSRWTQSGNGKLSHIKSVMMFPLVQQGKIFGVLQLVNASHVFALTLKGVNNHARAMHLKKLDLIAFAIMAAIQSTDLFHLRREYGFSNGTLVEAEFWCGLLDIVE